jgi:hypothetical protein
MQIFVFSTTFVTMLVIFAVDAIQKRRSNSH